MKRLLLLAALVACKNASPASPDAAPDAPPIGPTGPVTVYAPYPTQAPNAPPATAGATVLFYSADGQLVDRQTTDEHGTATGMAPENATVAVVAPPTSPGSYYAWVGVAPGDHLYTYRPVYPGLSNQRLDNLTIPSDGADVTSYAVGGTGYDAELDAPATTGNLTFAGTYFTDTPAVADLVGVATHSDGHQRFFAVHGVTLDSDAIDLSAATWSDPTATDIPITGITADTAWFDVDAEQRAGNQVLWSGTALAPPSSTAFVAHFDAPAPVADGRALGLLFQRGNANDSTATYWAASFNPAPASIDLAALRIDSTDVAVTSNAVTWGAQGDLVHAQGAYVLLFTQGSAPWEVILPPDARSFVPPQLPEDLPHPGVGLKAHVTFVAGNDPGGYAALRTDFAGFNLYAYGQIVPAPGLYRLAGY